MALVDVSTQTTISMSVFMESAATAAQVPKASKRKGVVNESVHDGASAAAKKSKPSTVKSRKKAKKSNVFPQKAPLAVPAEVDPDTTWRWFDQWQVWQARRFDTGKKTLFCGLCAFVSPSENTMLKHFIAEHGDKKFYSCTYCGDDPKLFCLGNNLRTHVKFAHSKVKNPMRYEWGPKKQRAKFCHNCGKRVWDSDEEEEEEESDHEYYEESTSDTDSVESGPGFEGAFDGVQLYAPKPSWAR